MISSSSYSCVSISTRINSNIIYFNRINSWPKEFASSTSMGLSPNRATYHSLTQLIEESMKDTLRKLKKVVDIGFVGGSDAKKIREQLDE